MACPNRHAPWVKFEAAGDAVEVIITGVAGSGVGDGLGSAAEVGVAGASVAIGAGSIGGAGVAGMIAASVGVAIGRGVGVGDSSLEGVGVGELAQAVTIKVRLLRQRCESFTQLPGLHRAG